LITKPLWTILPFRGDLPAFSGLPQLAWDGVEVDVDSLSEIAGAYSKSFRTGTGRCDPNEKEKTRESLEAGGLFCLDDVKEEVKREKETPKNKEKDTIGVKEAKIRKETSEAKEKKTKGI